MGQVIAPPGATSLPPTGAAGGSLAGTYPNPSIAADAITSAEIASNAVGSAEIAADAVGSSEIAAGAVGSTEIAADAVTATHIGANVIGTSELADNAVDSGAIAAGAVTETKMTTTPTLCILRRDATQSIAYSPGSALIDVDTTVADPLGTMADLANNRINIVKDGIYLVQVGVENLRYASTPAASSKASTSLMLHNGTVGFATFYGRSIDLIAGDATSVQNYSFSVSFLHRFTSGQKLQAQIQTYVSHASNNAGFEMLGQNSANLAVRWIAP
jgi:hypothetical protein